MVNDEFEARPLKLADIVKASEERRHSKKDKLQKHDPPKKESVKNYNSAPSNQESKDGNFIKLPTLVKPKNQIKEEP